MILDTSAVVAIVTREPGSQEVLRTMAGGNAAIGAATRLTNEPLRNGQRRASAGSGSPGRAPLASGSGLSYG